MVLLTLASDSRCCAAILSQWRRRRGRRCRLRSPVTLGARGWQRLKTPASSPTKCYGPTWHSGALYTADWPHVLSQCSQESDVHIVSRRHTYSPASVGVPADCVSNLVARGCGSAIHSARPGPREQRVGPQKEGAPALAQGERANAWTRGETTGKTAGRAPPPPRAAARIDARDADAAAAAVAAAAAAAAADRQLAAQSARRPRRGPRPPRRPRSARGPWLVHSRPELGPAEESPSQIRARPGYIRTRAQTCLRPTGWPRPPTTTLTRRVHRAGAGSESDRRSGIRWTRLDSAS
eukprot:scaffold4370_cov317-Prasinococcus_capsulatus_cf.AAC.2